MEIKLNSLRVFLTSYQPNSVHISQYLMHITFYIYSDIFFVNLPALLYDLVLVFFLTSVQPNSRKHNLSILNITPSLLTCMLCSADTCSCINLIDLFTRRWKVSWCLLLCVNATLMGTVQVPSCCGKASLQLLRGATPRGPSVSPSQPSAHCFMFSLSCRLPSLFLQILLKLIVRGSPVYMK